jgi:hypothetical protein
LPPRWACRSPTSASGSLLRAADWPNRSKHGDGRRAYSAPCVG